MMWEAARPRRAKGGNHVDMGPALEEPQSMTTAIGTLDDRHSETRTATARSRSPPRHVISLGADARTDAEQDLSPLPGRSFR
jgi:hypothetical protein